LGSKAIGQKKFGQGAESGDQMAGTLGAQVGFVFSSIWAVDLAGSG
jgi:hypothetical protein